MITLQVEKYGYRADLTYTPFGTYTAWYNENISCLEFKKFHCFVKELDRALQNQEFDKVCSLLEIENKFKEFQEMGII